MPTIASPLLAAKRHDHPSLFRPEALLREARRQRDLPETPVPRVCLLDPDGDIAAYCQAQGATRHPGWACYHTTLLHAAVPGLDAHVGILPHAVGAPFAVLVAEQLFVSGCQLLVSVTSAGRIAEDAPPLILIDRALRDEGTSHHYLPPDAFAIAPAVPPLAALEATIHASLPHLALRRGATWTTDAPYRETAAAIAAARDQQCLAVEMEAAALLAFASATARAVVCFAHVTNAMAQTHGDFEKGEAAGAIAALRLLTATARFAGEG